MGGTTTPSRGRRSRLARRLAVAALALAAALAAAEVAARTLAGGWDPEAALAEVARHVGAMSQSLPSDPGAPRDRRLAEVTEHELSPWFGFDTHGGVSTIASQERLFRRGPDGDPWVVIVVGGSVAGLTAARENERIASALGEHPSLAGREVVVLNHGRGSFKQPQQLHLVAQLLSLGVEPDAIVNVDGFNEVALGSHNAELGRDELDPHWTRWGHLGGAARADARSVALARSIAGHRDAARAWAARSRDWGLLRSALLGRLVVARIEAARGAWGRAQDAYVDHLLSFAESRSSEPRDAAAALRRIVEHWERSSRILAALCESRGIAYVHVLQPTLHDSEMRAPTPEELERGRTRPSMEAGVRAGYPLLRRAGAELAASGVRFVDASGLFADEPRSVYYDACHFGGAGMRAFADVVAGALVDAIAVQ